MSDRIHILPLRTSFPFPPSLGTNDKRLQPVPVHLTGVGVTNCAILRQAIQNICLLLSMNMLLNASMFKQLTMKLGIQTSLE